MRESGNQSDSHDAVGYTRRLPDNVGPRAICFHPTLNVVYSSDEQGSSATAYSLDPSAGTLSHLQTISTWRCPKATAKRTLAPRFKSVPPGNSSTFPTEGTTASLASQDRYIHWQAHSNRPGTHRGRTKGLQSRPGRQFSGCFGAGIGAPSVLPGQPRQRRAHPPDNLCRREQTHVGIDYHADWVG